MSIDYLTAGERRRPVLLMLHGIGGGAECFRPQLDAFAEDYCSVAWDMPGYGNSAPLQHLTFPSLADALARLIDEIGADQVHLIGHSIGGMIAQQFIADHPGRVRSLSLVATSAAFGSRDGDFQRRFLEDRLGPLERGATMAKLADSIVDSLTGHNPDPEMIGIARRCMADVPESSYRANMECLVTFDLRKELDKIRVPTLVVAGERDTNAPPAVMEKMASFIPDARYVCVPDAGHLINLEQPSTFNTVLRDFLQTVENQTETEDE